MKQPTAAQIAEIGLNYQEIGNEQITKLFGVSRNTAGRMKKDIQERMAAEGVKTWHPTNVNTRIAFEVWGLDIEKAEQALKRLQRLGMEAKA